MKTKQGIKIVKELEMVGGSYFNNYGVDVYQLENGNIFLQAKKLGQKIKNHWAEISKCYFIERFRDENRCDFENFKDAMDFLDPDFDDLNA